MSTSQSSAVCSSKSERKLKRSKSIKLLGARLHTIRNIKVVTVCDFDTNDELGKVGITTRTELICNYR